MSSPEAERVQKPKAFANGHQGKESPRKVMEARLHSQSGVQV
jgi:hypothetical protein